MKNIISVLILGFSFSFLTGNTNPEQEKSNVIAFSGLKMRSAPSTKAKVIDIIPFGESVSLIENTDSLLTVEWLNGQWSKVNYQGMEGYVFDGFLTHLPIPTQEFELTQSDLDLAYPILGWAENNYDYVYEPDTVERMELIKHIQYLENDIVLTRIESDYYFKSILEMSDVRIGDAYNLIRSMLLTKSERSVFEENSVFISNDLGEVDKIKINIDSPVEIRKTGENRIKISVVSFHEGCGL